MMKVHRVLELGSAGSSIMYFGECDSVEEIKQVYQLRYKVYSERGYIDIAKHKEDVEHDEYDDRGVCHYFIAKFGEKVIGCVRIIIDDPLPTEKAFEFNEPAILQVIPRPNRCELGRLIIVPPNKDRGEYLPRGLVMLFLLDSLVAFGLENNLLGGYSFVKKSLADKMRRLRMPFSLIEPYKQHYPKEGVLYRYFSQANNPVIPICFLLEDFKKYCDKHIHVSKMFGYENGHFILNNNLYVSFLKTLKII